MLRYVNMVFKDMPEKMSIVHVLFEMILNV